jgi:hypothetical protein
MIYLRRVIERRSRDDYIELKADYMRQVVPDFCRVVTLLLENVIQRDHYEQGTKSYGYRLVDEGYRCATHRLIPITDARLRKRLSDHRKRQANTALHRWLRKQLDRISLGDIDEAFLRTVAVRQTLENGGAVEDKIKAYAEALDLIQRQAWYWESGDKFGYRVFHNVSGLKRELRRFLRVHGQPLVEIDIKGSQLLFLALEMKRRHLPCGDFLERCQGDVYQYVADHARTTRAKVKQAITQRALFAPNDHRCQRSRIKRAFDRLFPEVAGYIQECKDGDHRELAKQLQRAESGFMLRTVCNRLRLERPDLFVVTIHDSILCLPNDAEYIRGVMLDEFGKHGVQPRLEIKAMDD